MSTRVAALLHNQLYRSRAREVKPEDDNLIKTVFHENDDGLKGFLNREDLKMAFISLFGFKPSKIEIDELVMRWSSSDHECKIHLDQFLELMRVRWSQIDEDDEIRNTFLTFDSKCQGFLTIDDLKKAFGEVAPHMSSSTLETAFREIDRDGDGRVSYKDFEFMMKYSSDEHF